jgi:hypothetical protein
MYSLISLIAVPVLSNTDLDYKIEHIQVMSVKKKYGNTEYDDKTIDNLMKYFEAENYEQLESFLKNSHIPLFN